MRDRPTLTHADATAIMAAARARARQGSFAVCVCIVDDSGTPLLLERLDGARSHTPEAATLKARTAAIVRADTASLQAAIAADPALLAFPGRLPLAGGMPIVHRGEVVGGIGSSGGASEDDEAVCRAGLAAFAAISAAEGGAAPG